MTEKRSSFYSPVVLSLFRFKEPLPSSEFGCVLVEDSYYTASAYLSGSQAWSCCHYSHVKLPCMPHTELDQEGLKQELVLLPALELSHKTTAGRIGSSCCSLPCAALLAAWKNNLCQVQLPTSSRSMEGWTRKGCGKNTYSYPHYFFFFQITPSAALPHLALHKVHGTVSSGSISEKVLWCHGLEPLV